MGQALRGIPEAPALKAGKGAPPFAIGAYLARQRGLRGISLEELEVTTRIPRRSLERLEAGAFDQDRDAFARGFVKTVAQALGLDVHDTIARMLAEERPRRRVRDGPLLRSRLLWGALVALGLAAASIAAVRARSAGFALPSLAALRSEPRAVVVRPDPLRVLAHEVRVRADAHEVRVRADARAAPQSAQGPEPSPQTVVPAP